MSRRLREIEPIIEEQLIGRGRFEIERPEASRELARLSAVVARGDTGSVWLVDSAADVLRMEATYGSAMQQNSDLGLHLGESLHGWVWRNGHEASLDDILMDARFSDAVLVSEGVRSVLAAPLIGRGAVRGVISSGRRAVRPFSRLDSRSLVAFADVVSGLAWPAAYRNPRAASPRLVSPPARSAGILGNGASAHMTKELESIAADAIAHVPVEACVVWIKDDYVHDWLVLQKMPGAEITTEDLEAWAGATVAMASRAAREGEAYPFLSPQLRCSSSFKELITPLSAVPIRTNGAIKGMLAVFGGDKPSRLQQAECMVLEMLATRAGLVAANFEMACRLDENTRKLEQIRVHKERFLPVIGHSLRTPLTSIKGFAQLMIRESGDGTPHFKQAGTILRESNRLSSTIDEIVALDGMEARIAALDVETVSLLELLKDSHALATRSDDAQSATRLVVPAVDLMVRAERKETKRLLASLLRSLLAMRSGASTVELTVSFPRGQAQILISTRISRLDRRTILAMLNQPFSHSDLGDAETRRLARELYVARNLLEAQGATLRGRWRSGGELTLIVTFPAINNARGRK